MTTVYFDPGALLSPRGAEATDAVVDAEAARMVHHLKEFGHDVVILWRDASPDVAAASQHGSGAALPDGEADLASVDTGSVGWFVSDRPERCAAAHELRRLRTVLVGAAETRDLAHRPADRMARSLPDAVLDILASEAMDPPAAEADPS
ncbi:MAG: hypothetical protein U0838_03005 [Chloroflexota bacterium]